MNFTSFDKAVALRDEFEQARKSALEELLEQRREIDRRLATLGRGRPTAESGSAKTCPICGERGHDRRRHRAGKGMEAASS